MKKREPSNAPLRVNSGAMRLPEYVDRGREAIDSLVDEISIGERSQVAPALRLAVEKNPEAIHYSHEVAVSLGV